MNAKDKAKELFDKFTCCAPLHSDNKECALIAVDEILFSNNTLFETNIPHECWKYWIEVKQEIEKL